MKKGIIVCASIIGVVLLYYALLTGLFLGLYDSHSKEQVFLQETSLGVLTIMKDTGDPLSADYWEFYIDNQLIDSSGLNVPPVSLSNVPGISESNVPPIAETNVPGVSL